MYHILLINKINDLRDFLCLLENMIYEVLTPMFPMF